eukprot:6491718-Amphidinium_carterae.1
MAVDKSCVTAIINGTREHAIVRAHCPGTVKHLCTNLSQDRDVPHFVKTKPPENALVIHATHLQASQDKTWEGAAPSAA